MRDQNRRALVAGLTSAAALAAAGAAQASPADDDVITVNPQDRGRWLRAETPHFVLYSAEGEDVLRSYAAMLETVDGVLRRQHGKVGAPITRKYEIYLTGQTSEMAKSVAGEFRRFDPRADGTSTWTPVAALDGIFGVCMRDRMEHFGFIDRTQGDDIVIAGYSEAFFSQNFPYSYPSWFVLGLQIYYSSLDLRPDKIVIGMPPPMWAQTIRTADLLRMSVVLGKPAWDREGREYQTLYAAQSWLLMHYLLSSPERRTKLADYLKRIELGDVDLIATWKDVFDETPVELGDKLRHYSGHPMPAFWIAHAPEPAPPITFQRLPAGADDLIMYSQRLKAGVEDYQKADLLRTFRAAGRRRPDERYTRQALARAEIKLGDRAEGEAILKQLLLEDGGNLEALQLMGESKVEAGLGDPARRAALFAEAEPYLRDADKADPDNYLTLFMLARTRWVDGAPSAEALELLRRSAILAPLVAEIRLRAGEAFVVAGDDRTAYVLLTAVAGDPYGTPEGAKARSLIRDILARSAAGPASG
jgi:tetratricopeptide (TPR) repeat protein